MDTVTVSGASRSWSDLDDDELVEIYRDQGIEAAFETLVRRYQVRVFRVLVGMVDNAALAEEVAQQAFVKAAMRIEQLRDGNAFYGWLLTIARSAALDELRKRKRRETHQLQETDDGVSAPKHDTRQAVRRALAELRPDDRLIILLADLEQRTMPEIAHILDIGESAAKMRLKRARERFKQLFGDRS